MVTIYSAGRGAIFLEGCCARGEDEKREERREREGEGERERERGRRGLR